MDFEFRASNVNFSGPAVIGPEYLREHLAMGVPYLVVLVFWMCWGTAGNMLIIATIVSDKALRSAGNIFIVNLAIADLCVNAFVDPFSVVGLVAGEAYFLEHWMLCETVASICLISCFCSLLSIGAISFNRYVHICHHHLYNTIYTPRNAFFICIGLWMAGVAADLPNFFGWGDHAFDKKQFICVYDRTADLSYTLFFCLGGIATPIVVISICYLKIFLFVRASKTRVAGGGGDSQGGGGGKGTDVKSSVRLARTLFFIFAIFVACWTPYAIIVAVDVNDEFPAELHTYAVLVAHTNSSLNCVLYGVTNRQFRDGYARVLHAVFPCVPRASAKKGKGEGSSMGESELTGETKLETSQGKAAS